MLGLTAAFAGGAALVYAFSPAMISHPPTKPPAHHVAHHAPVSRTLPPCGGEEGFTPRPCLWDAATRGNHKGKSFIVTSNGMLVYLDGSNLPEVDPAS